MNSVRDLPITAAALSINLRVTCGTRRFMVVVVVRVEVSFFAERDAEATAGDMVHPLKGLWLTFNFACCCTHNVYIDSHCIHVVNTQKRGGGVIVPQRAFL